MNIRILGLAVALLASFPLQAAEKNVILLMLDGVRWQEVFRGVDPDLAQSGETGETFPYLRHELIRSGVVFGNRDKGSTMTVANSRLNSLPAYQSIMSGFTQPCGGNSCGRIGVETVQERVLRDLNVARSKVATIASWEKIPHAVEHVEGTTFVNAAFEPLDDGTNDPIFAKINAAQKSDTPPWEGARYDRYTFAHAMHYLEKYQPRFMFISLDDSDEHGHRGEYTQYIETLRQYDKWIAELVSKLAALGDYGRNTTLIITTDHGRGDGVMWRQHGVLWPESKYIWLFGAGPHAARQRAFHFDNYTHADIRPTMEAALELKPQSCQKCGHVIREIVAGRNN